jgi:ubiquinone/menaquinone biosynthesis C-methylase UbiE
MPNPDWNDRYKTKELPWDTNEPDDNLVNLIKNKTVSPCKALEIGCGTGTNSLWLARQGFSMLGVDISQEAVDRANRKKENQSLICDFAQMDFLHDESLSQSFDFVFDRGCFHVFDLEQERILFAKQVSRVLKKNGKWVSLIGSTEGSPRDAGPPRRTAIEVVVAVEPYLEITELRSVLFQTNSPSAVRAWLCIATQRNEAAQPSTRRHL